MSKKALGKGLGALIGGRGAPSPEAEKILGPQHEGEQVENLPIQSVGPSPMQPRKTFNAENLSELVSSIEEQGLIQPLIVRRVGKNFELIAGERRWRACQEIGLETVPAIVREADDQTVLELALIENLQREDLNPIEEAAAYAKLAKEFKLKQEEIAERVGKNRATVANAIRLLDLEKSVQAELAKGHLTVGHAKALLGLKKKADQKKMASQVISSKLTVRDTEALVKGLLNPDADDTPSGDGKGKGGGQDSGKKGAGAGYNSGLEPELAEAIESIETRLRQHFATSVRVVHTPKKGKIEVEYYGSQDLDRILEEMGVLDD